MSSGPPTTQLVEQARAGQPAARRLIFDTYAPYLRRVLNRQLGHDQELPDLLHDVFVAAFESLDRLEQPHALPGFLTQIAVNVARSHVRRCVQRRALAEAVAQATAYRRAHLDHVACEAALSAHELLWRLPHEQRVPLTLRVVAEMELSEVAATCRVSVPTVKRRLSAAKRRLTRLTSMAPATPAPA